jgi:hypothetical protein
LPEGNEPNIRPARSVFWWLPAAARSLWVWLLCAAAAVGVVVVLVASLPYPPWESHSSADRRTTAPTGEPSPAPAAPVAAAPGAALAIFAWRDGEGTLHRAGIDPARYNEFVAAGDGQIEQDQRALVLAQGNRLRAGLAPLFEKIDERVSGYADWVFDWWTSWILLARTFGWTWDSLTTGSLLTLPDRVQAKLVAAVQEQFIGRVLEPRALEPQIEEAVHGALAAVREDLVSDCAKYQQSLSDFIRSQARQVERQDLAQGWVPDPAWERSAATFQLLCDPAGAVDDTASRAQLPVLLELKSADGPVNDVILRMARPFATKLISFVVLPVIVAAILGGILLPLFGQLPGVLANVVTGILTGAFGGLIIGLAASASVDWMLNRTDATLNRPGLEVSVRRAIISTERNFENRVIETQQRAIDHQMQVVATAMAGKIAAP